MLERYFNFRLNELPVGSFQQTDICSNSHLPTTNNDGGDVVEEVAVDNDVRDAHKEVVEDSDVPEDSDDDGGDALEEVAEAVEVVRHKRTSISSTTTERFSTVIQRRSLQRLRRCRRIHLMRD